MGVKENDAYVTYVVLSNYGRIGVRLIFENSVIRAGVKGAGVKKGPALKRPIR